MLISYNNKNFYSIMRLNSIMLWVHNFSSKFLILIKKNFTINEWIFSDPLKIFYSKVLSSEYFYLKIFIHIFLITIFLENACLADIDCSCGPNQLVGHRYCGSVLIGRDCSNDVLFTCGSDYPEPYDGCLYGCRNSRCNASGTRRRQRSR